VIVPPRRSLRSASAAALVVVCASAAAAGPRADATAAPTVDEPAVARLATAPLGLPPVPPPAGEPPSPALIALGRKLFFDRRLSPNGTMSCGMCHIPEQGFTSQELATPVGAHGRSLRRNAPTLVNVLWVDRLFHDGRAASLEAQVEAPLFAEDEMANPSAEALVARLASFPDYEAPFDEALGAGPSLAGIARAIAAWERTLVAGRSSFDRWRYGGETEALSDEERRGFALFTGAANCAACHPVGPDHALLTDLEFHDTGIGVATAATAAGDTPVPVEIAPGRVVRLDRDVVRSVGEPPVADLGRFEVTGDPADRHRFRTPSLRNVALTAPYMHDGSLRTLEEVVRFYDRGGVPHPGLDPRIQPLGLSDADVAALVAFLTSLTSPEVAALIDDARSVEVGNP